MKIEAQLRKKFRTLGAVFDERSRRLFAAVEARALGYGGVSLVSRVTGVSRRAIHAGFHEIRKRIKLPAGRIRQAGGGRKNALAKDPQLMEVLESLIEPRTRGDPQSTLRWTCKSTQNLSDELCRRGHRASDRLVASLLHRMGYSLQGNRKTQEGQQHPDRNAQFEHINQQASVEIQAGNPVISVDTKKKELIGNYKNAGEKWCRKGQAPQVQSHDFPQPSVPRAHPYGIYDLAKNTGWVNVGTSHDTAAFAVASIRGWWRSEGRGVYPRAQRLFITADAGGSNGSRLRLWKWELQRLANETNIPIAVSHFPPGTSKWNKIEHRLFSFITRNWKGEPLVDYQTIIRLIAGTKTATGLRVNCKLDKRFYPPGRRISDAEMATIQLTRNAFHGDWNYIVSPQRNL